MAYFAEINESDVVIRVVALDDTDTHDASGNEVEAVGAKYLSDGFGGTWKRTSYNTSGGIHKLGETPFRKNFAGKGYIFDAAKDAFYTPQPFDSWTLTEATCQWDAPTARPDDGKMYTWNEPNTKWVEVN
jgi:hypothetical protein